MLKGGIYKMVRLPRKTSEEIKELQKDVEKEISDLKEIEKQNDEPQQGTNQEGIYEVEVNLSLLNNKLNHIISKLDELHK